MENFTDGGNFCYSLLKNMYRSQLLRLMAISNVEWLREALSAHSIMVSDSWAL